MLGNGYILPHKKEHTPGSVSPIRRGGKKGIAEPRMQTGSRAQNADGEPSPECRGGSEPRMQIRWRAQNGDGEPSPKSRGGGKRVMTRTQKPKNGNEKEGTGESE